jgi:hypothetical protein
MGVQCKLVSHIFSLVTLASVVVIEGAACFLPQPEYTVLLYRALRLLEPHSLQFLCQSLSVSSVHAFSK